MTRMETFAKQRGRGLLVGNLIARFEGLSSEQREMGQDTNQVGHGGQVFMEHNPTGGGRRVINRAQGQPFDNNVQKGVIGQGEGQGGAIPPMDPNAMNWLVNQVQEQVQALMKAHMQAPNPTPNQVDLKTCRDLVMPPAGLAGHSPIRLPPITANTMHIGQNIINMIRDNSTFRGTEIENPYLFLDHYHEVCRTIRMDGVSEEAIKLLLFPFAIKDQARAWYDSLRHDSLHTWTEVVSTFLLKYYPPGKVLDLRVEIMTFDAYEDESLSEAWNRYKALLRQCPAHGVTLGDQIHYFFRGLDRDMQNQLHVSCGGDIMMLPPNQAFDQIERITEASRLYESETRRGPRRKKPSEMKLVREEIEDDYHAKVSGMKQNCEKLEKEIERAKLCQLCGGGHLARECTSMNKPPMVSRPQPLRQWQSNNMSIDPATITRNKMQVCAIGRKGGSSQATTPPPTHMPQQNFTKHQFELIRQMSKDMQELKESTSSAIRNLQERIVQLLEKRRLEQEEETRKELENVRKEQEEAYARKVAIVDGAMDEDDRVESEDDDFDFDEALPELEIELGSPILPEAPIKMSDYGRFHVLPITPSLPEMEIDYVLMECVVEPTTVITKQEFFGDDDSSLWDEESMEELEMEEVKPLSITPSPPEMKIDDALVECVVEPTIDMTEQEFSGDDDSSFWDEDELDDLEMAVQQLYSLTLPPDEIKNDDTEECIVDLSTFFEETDFEFEEEPGSPISPSPPIEVCDDVSLECMVKSHELGMTPVVELPEEFEIISIPVSDYHTLPLCVEEHYLIEFGYSPVVEAHKILEDGQLPWDDNFKKEKVMDFDERGFSGWQEVASRAMRGKSLVNSFLPMLAIFILLELLIFLSSDFG